MLTGIIKGGKLIFFTHISGSAGILVIWCGGGDGCGLFAGDRDRLGGRGEKKKNGCKKSGLKFLILTIIHTFAFPKKTVDQCFKGFGDDRA